MDPTILNKFRDIVDSMRRPIIYGSGALAGAGAEMSGAAKRCYLRCDVFASCAKKSLEMFRLERIVYARVFSLFEYHSGGNPRFDDCIPERQSPDGAYNYLKDHGHDEDAYWDGQVIAILRHRAGGEFRSLPGNTRVDKTLPYQLRGDGSKRK